MGVEVDPSCDTEGLVATWPQMLALLHINGSNLHSLKADMVTLNTSLQADTSATPPAVRIKRVIYIREPPQCSGFAPGQTQVRVLYPADSTWAKEMFLWA